MRWQLKWRRLGLSMHFKLHSLEKRMPGFKYRAKWMMASLFPLLRAILKGLHFKEQLRSEPMAKSL